MDEEGRVRAGAAWEHLEEMMVPASARSRQVEMDPMSHYVNFSLEDSGIGTFITVQCQKFRCWQLIQCLERAVESNQLEHQERDFHFPALVFSSAKGAHLNPFPKLRRLKTDHGCT